jgi:phytol kinase
MIMRIVLLVAVLLPTLLVLQWLNDKYKKDNEAFRKIIHVFHGVTLAALAFIVPLYLLIIVEAFLLSCMAIGRYLYLDGYFGKMRWVQYVARLYEVGRISYGEYLYPISAILLILLTDDKWVFAASILTLGLADAAAALVGKKYGKRTTYTILGQKKSLVGSTAFYIVALGVVFAFAKLAEPAMSVSVFTVLWVTLVITFSENIGVYGTDNLLIPLTTAYLLSAL